MIALVAEPPLDAAVVVGGGRPGLQQPMDGGDNHCWFGERLDHLGRPRSLQILRGRDRHQDQGKPSVVGVGAIGVQQVDAAVGAAAQRQVKGAGEHQQLGGVSQWAAALAQERAGGQRRRPAATPQDSVPGRRKQAGDLASDAGSVLYEQDAGHGRLRPTPRSDAGWTSTGGLVDGALSADPVGCGCGRTGELPRRRVPVVCVVVGRRSVSSRAHRSAVAHQVAGWSIHAHPLLAGRSDRCMVGSRLLVAA